MRRFILLTLIALSMRSFATEQIPELFVINGQEYEINSYPLEALYGYEEIILMLDNNMRCSANWRGYRGVWELANKELTLNSLVNGACDANAPSVNPEYFFGEKSFPVKFVWFSGKIEVRTSERIPISKINSESGKQAHGEKYQATVYVFVSGELISKSEEEIEHWWY